MACHRPLGKPDMCWGFQVSLRFIDDSTGANFETALPCKSTSGAFSLRLAEGSYRVLASRGDAASSTSFPDPNRGPKPRFQGHRAHHRRAVERSYAPHSGRLLFDGLPPEGGKPDGNGAELLLRFVNDDGADFAYTIPSSDSTGRFSLRLPAGHYRVLAKPIVHEFAPSDATFVLSKDFRVSAPLHDLTWNMAKSP